VHDAARPLVNAADVKAVVWALGDAAGAVLCSRVTDTVKRVDGNGLVIDTLARDQLRLAQTPQVLRITALERAWQGTAPEREFTDEASLLEVVGMPVRSVIAQHPNPKITTRDDLALVRSMLGVS
jgi:2-C-methyl-D-erythritol 4-phosphate cytidylyltransferase